MGSVVSAITGSGAKKAASAQAAAAEDAIATQRESLAAQLKLGRESLQLQKDMFEDAMKLGIPYRDAGSTALAQYESLLYGIPINKTAAYRSVASPGSLGDYKYSSKDQIVKELYGSEKYLNKTDDWATTVTDMNALNAEADKTWADQELQKKTDLDRQKGLIDTMDEFGGVDQMDALVKTPGYQFRMNEGQKAIERSAAAKSGILSGAQVKANERFAQDYASNEFGTYMDRLGGLINTGSANAGAAAAMTGNAANAQSGVLNNMINSNANSADAIGALQTQVGAAKASGYLGEQEAGTNLLNGAFGAAGRAGGFGKLFGF